MMFSLNTWAQDDIIVKPVQFKKGTSSVSLNDQIVGYQTVDYTLVAKSGQTMKVDLISKHLATYFNVIVPSEENVAIFIGQTTGNSCELNLPEDGKYKIRVYMMRSAARRNEKANYTLNISITGDPTLSGDAKVAGTPYHATGILSCSVGSDPKGSANCDFGVIRKGTDQAEVHISVPGGDERILIFEGNKVYTKDNSLKVKSAKVNYDWEISINDMEFYTIPDAVINGG